MHNISARAPVVKKKLSVRFSRMWVVWLFLLITICFCYWQVSRFRRLKAEIERVQPLHSQTIAEQIDKLRGQIYEEEQRLAQLEKDALWPKEKDLGLWFSEQARSAKTLGAKFAGARTPRSSGEAAVQIIGVEHQPGRQVDRYWYAPVKFTLRGDYHSFGRLINRLERSQHRVKIDYLSITQRKYAPEYLILSLVLAYVSKTERPLRADTRRRSYASRRETPKTRSKQVERKEKSSGYALVNARAGTALTAPSHPLRSAPNTPFAGFVYPSGEGIRDPFFRGDVEVKTDEEGKPPSFLSLFLTGIIWDEKEPIAIFVDRRRDSYLAKVNDEVLSMKVLQIHRRSVILESAGTQLELRVFKDEELLSKLY